MSERTISKNIADARLNRAVFTQFGSFKLDARRLATPTIIEPLETVSLMFCNTATKCVSIKFLETLTKAMSGSYAKTVAILSLIAVKTTVSAGRHGICAFFTIVRTLKLNVSTHAIAAFLAKLAVTIGLDFTGVMKVNTGNVFSMYFSTYVISNILTLAMAESVAKPTFFVVARPEIETSFSCSHHEFV